MLISKAARQDFVNRHFNSYLWMKKLTEKEIRAELAHLKVRPIFKTQPWLHQLVCWYIGMCEPRFLFLLDMGAGKSKILMDLMTQYQREKKMSRALVAVPRLINIGSWEEDIERHSNLEPILCGMPTIEEKWDTLMTGDGDLALIDYQGLCLAVCDKGKKGGGLIRNDKKVKMLRKRFDFIGIDEIHKLKNHESLWYSVMWQIAKEARFCYGTTGTLFGKDPEDLWSQFKLVDRGETFGENLGLFRSTFYDSKPDPWKGKVLTFDRKKAPLLNEMIQNRSIRYNDREFSDVPPAIFVTRNLHFGEEQRQHYLQALEGLINAGGKLSDLEAPWIRMRQITSGYLQWKDEHGPHTIRFKENPKLEALEAIIDEAGGSKVVISHEYTETGHIITEMLAARGIKFVWLYGGSKDPIALRKQFIDDPETQVFVMNSAAGGTGVDGLQRVCRYMVLYESPPDPITRKQLVKRIDRPGQKSRAKFFDLVVRGSVDSGILEDVAEGINLHQSVLDPVGLAVRLKKLFRAVA